MVLSFDKIAGCAIIAANNLNVNYEGKVYQIRGDKSLYKFRRSCDA